MNQGSGMNTAPQTVSIGMSAGEPVAALPSAHDDREYLCMLNGLNGTYTVVRAYQESSGTWRGFVPDRDLTYGAAVRKMIQQAGWAE